jgi:hypothetical protein
MRASWSAWLTAPEAGSAALPVLGAATAGVTVAGGAEEEAGAGMKSVPEGLAGEVSVIAYAP